MKLKQLLFFFIFVGLTSCMFDTPYEEVHYNGQLVNSSGKPLDLAKIYVSGFEYADTFHTALDGSFDVLLPRGGIYRILFIKYDYATLDKVLAFKGGDVLTEELVMKNREESAYMHAVKERYEITYEAGKLVVLINSNVNYTWSTNVDWLTPGIHSSGVELTYTQGDDDISRIGYLYLSGEYDLKDTVQIIQMPNPALLILTSERFTL